MRKLGELKIGTNCRNLNENEMKVIKGGYDNSSCETSDPLYCDGPCESVWYPGIGWGGGNTVEGKCNRLLGYCMCNY